MSEEWKQIKGYEGHYDISNHGRIKSHQRGDPFIMKQSTHYKGHKYIYLMIGGRKNRKKFFVHRLVACAFIPNPENKDVVNHINCIKADNLVTNLEWMTGGDNTRYHFATKDNKPLNDIPF